MQSGNTKGEEISYRSPHLIKIKIKMQKAERPFRSGRPWRGGAADTFRRCSSRKGRPLYPKEEYVNVRL